MAWCLVHYYLVRPESSKQPPFKKSLLERSQSTSPLDNIQTPNSILNLDRSLCTKQGEPLLPTGASSLREEHCEFHILCLLSQNATLFLLLLRWLEQRKRRASRSVHRIGLRDRTQIQMDLFCIGSGMVTKVDTFRSLLDLNVCRWPLVVVRHRC